MSLIALPSMPTLPGHLVRREHGTLAAHPLWAVGAHDDAPQARTDGAAHVLLHADLQPRPAASRLAAEWRRLGALATAAPRPKSRDAQTCLAACGELG